MDVVIGSLLRVVTGPVALRRWAVATLVANVVIVVTGGVVRLTGSGLGCPTWPRCTAASYVTHPALGVHGVIEFSNRMLTFVLVVVAILTLVTAWRTRLDGRPRPDLGVLAAVLAFGIPIQAVIGGVSVLTRLNPYVVALHLLASLALIGLAVLFVRRVWDLPSRPATGLGFVLPRLTLVLTAVVVCLGTTVTGSGPHAGDEHAARNGLNGLMVTQLHTFAVYATVAATLACAALLRSRAALLLLLVEVGQAGIGFWQYYTGLPVVLVALHLLGATLAVAAATNLALSVRGPAGETATAVSTEVLEVSTSSSG